MKLKFSPHFAVQIKNHDKAIPFYRDILGMSAAGESDNETVLACGEAHFYFEDNPAGSVYFDFEVDDINNARKILEDNGCRVVRATTPEGTESYLVYDPYGMKFHIWQK